MKRKIAFVLLMLFTAMCLAGFVSCEKIPDNGNNDNNNDNNGNNNNPDDKNDKNTYVVIWKNYDGVTLETDQNVEEGAVPSYNGATPTRADEGAYSFAFDGWTPDVTAVTGNVTYTAKFKVIKNGEPVVGIDPVLSADGKTAKYGFYPQTRVSDTAVIAELNKLSPSQLNGWYLYDGNYYAKQTATVYNNESYVFDDGEAIVNGQEYYFKCEPICWRVLKESDGKYVLLSDKLLDVGAFYGDYLNRTVDGVTVRPNNYSQSDVRSFLNGQFYNTAFALNDSYVQIASVDNGASTTQSASNAYVCADTTDKVFLPSYGDCLNSAYGFAVNNDVSTSRQCKTTDYARVGGAWCSKTNGLLNNGSYWTRSPSGEFYYCAWNVNSGGYLSEYAVDGASHCVRPCITVVVSR